MTKTTYRIFTIGWSLIILFLTLFPDAGGDKFWLLEIQGMDKVAHFGLFFILSFLSYLSFYVSHHKNVIKITIGYGVLLACITEFGQLYVEGRNGDVYDLAADTLGLLIGLFVVSNINLKK